MKTAVYAGTFDPITNGHLNVLARAAKVFDQVIIAVAADHNKQTLFTLEERTALVKESVAHLENVQAKVFSGLLVNFAREQGATALVRGLRMVSDFEYAGHIHRHIYRAPGEMGTWQVVRGEDDS